MHEFKSGDLFKSYQRKEQFAFVLSTSERSFLYRVKQSDSATLHFVHVAVKKTWVYIGVLSYGNFKLTSRSNFRFYEPECAVFGKTWDRVISELPLPTWVIAHSPTKCKECGGWLFDYESVIRGIGPRCARKALERENKELKDELEAIYGMTLDETA